MSDARSQIGLIQDPSLTLDGATVAAWVDDISGTVRRFLRADGPSGSWLTRRYAEHLGAQAVDSEQTRFALRTALVVDAPETPRLGQHEARCLLQASIRGAHPRAFLEGWLGAELAPMRVARRGDTVTVHSLAEPGLLAHDVDLAIELRHDGAAILELPDAAEAAVAGWLVEPRALGLRVLLSLAPMRQDQLDRLVTVPVVASDLLRVLLAPDATGGRERSPRVLPPEQVDAIRSAVAHGLDRYRAADDADLPPTVLGRAFTRRPVTGRMRWTLAEAVDPDPVLSQLTIAFERVRWAVLPASERAAMATPDAPGLDAWVALDDVPELFGFTADGEVAGIGEWSLQALPLDQLDPERALVMRDALPAAPSIADALVWADANREADDADVIVSAFRELRTRARWTAVMRELLERTPTSDVWPELLRTARTELRDVAQTRLHTLGLAAATLKRLDAALPAGTQSAVSALPQSAAGLTMLDGIGDATVAELAAAILDQVDAPVRERQPAERRERAPELDAGLDELGDLFETAASGATRANRNTRQK